MLGGNLTVAGVLVAVAAVVAFAVAAVTIVLVLARNRRRARRAVHGISQAAADGAWRPGDLGYGDTLRANTIHPDEWPEAWQDDRRAGGGNDELGKRPDRPAGGAGGCPPGHAGETGWTARETA